MARKLVKNDFKFVIKALYIMYTGLAGSELGTAQPQLVYFIYSI